MSITLALSFSSGYGFFMPVYKTMTIALPEPVWRLAEKLRKVVNAKLQGMDKKPMTISGIATLILFNSLIEQAADIQDEYDQVGLDILSVRLADLIGRDELAAAGLPQAPDLPHTRRANRGPRADRIFT